MAIYKRLDAIVAGINAGLRQDSVYQNLGLSLSTTGAQTNNVPSSGTFPIAYSCGWIRTKIYNGGGTTPAVASVKVLASDGTNVVVIDYFNPAAAHTLTTTSWYDRSIFFLVDVAASGAGGGAAGQLIALNGISQLQIITTLSGTTPTATMDLEAILAI